MSSHRPSARARAAKAPRLTRSGLQLGDRTVPLLSGAVHYFRLARPSWRPALEALRALGLHMVETYVPWGEHELADGRLDFGSEDPSKDLAAFLDLAHELELLVFLRPGPNVNAELAYFGLPRRIVLDERNQARSARGHALPMIAPPRMFPVPSYASRHFRSELDAWFQAVGAIVAPRRWPDGPVVLLQVDNEAAFYFRDAPYDSDYHPDALADFAAFLERRYRTLDSLNRVYASEHASFADVPAPRRFTATRATELVPHLDWVAFHEQLLCDALSAMRRQLADAGMSGLPVVHNLPMGELGLPTGVTALGERVDLVGLDYYHLRGALDHVRRRTQRLCGSAPHAFAPELGVGAPPWFAPRSDADSLMSAMTACAYGLRGMNLYMAVERDRWYGAPIDVDGEARPHAETWRKLLAALGRVEHHRLRLRAQVALIVPREYALLTRATHALGALSPSLLDLAGVPASSACRNDPFGFAQPIQLTWEAWLARVDHALYEQQVPFVYVDGDAELEALPDLRAVITPCFELCDPQRWRRLERFAARGGHVLVGPHLRMQPHAFAPIAGRAAPLALEDAYSAETLVRELALGLELERPVVANPYPVAATLHVDEHDRPRALFVVQPAALDTRAELRLPSALSLVDALSGERFAGSALDVPMRAQSCRMLIVEGSGDAR
jgi:beta-galactosidase